MRYTLNVQPVIPFSLGTDWNLITRTIVPFIHAESPVKGGDDAGGIGDIVQSFFLSPKEPLAGWIVGGGPVFLYPSEINVEVFRGAVRKGNWKLVKIALLPGKTELFDLSKDPGEKTNVADQFPRWSAIWKRVWLPTRRSKSRASGSRLSRTIWEHKASRCSILSSTLMTVASRT